MNLCLDYETSDKKDNIYQCVYCATQLQEFTNKR